MRRANFATAASVRLIGVALTIPVALGASAARADEPRAAVRGVTDDRLETQIEQAVGEAKAAPKSRIEARRRAREAADAAQAVLRSEGYYAAEIDPSLGEGEAPQPVITVTAGRRFLLAAPKIDWVGDVPDADAQAAGDKAMALKAGGPGRAVEVIAAEGRIVAAIQKRGYADAAAAPREVIVDHADFSVRPTYRIEAGKLVRLNGLDMHTRGRTKPDWVRRLAPWKPGDVYDPDKVAELERRLLDTGAYNSVTVALAPETATVNGLRPVVVSLADRPRSTIDLGVNYSTSEGEGVDAKWVRYNRFGRADTLTVLAKYAQIERLLQIELSLPHWLRPQQTFKARIGAIDNDTDAYRETGVSTGADITRRFGKTSYFTYGATLKYGRTVEKMAAADVIKKEGQDLVTLIGLAAFFLDRSNNPLNPTQGWRLDSRLEPTVTLDGGGQAYVKAQAQATGYLPFGEKASTVIAGRVKVGSITGVKDVYSVAAPQRFFAGGGGSVRGYSYQGVGPRFADNSPEGGRSLFEASLELRQRITEKWGVVAFVDAGSVDSRATPEFRKVNTGAGLGVRYDLGFGPIRADVAIPLNKNNGDPDYQLYLSIGQSF